MVLESGKVALLDWGLAATLDVETRALLARIVLLLNLRDKAEVRRCLLDLECNARNLRFNAAATDDHPDFVVAFMLQFFDTSADGADVDDAVFARLFYLLAHEPSNFPTLCALPKEVVLFVRTVSALRKCLRAVGAPNVAASRRWAPYAPGREKGASMSLQRANLAMKCVKESVHSLRTQREMISRPKMSRNE